MPNIRRGWLLALASCLLPAALAAQQAPFSFAATTRLVLVNLSVRDSQGRFVRDLIPTNITITEDGKPQAITSMELEDLDREPEDSSARSAATALDAPTAAADPTVPENFRGRRLMVLFFDWTTMAAGFNLGEMTVGNAQAAVEWSLKYVQSQMLPADTVEIVSSGRTLEMEQAFTGNKDQLTAVLTRLLAQAKAMALPNQPDVNEVVRETAPGRGAGGRGRGAPSASAVLDAAVAPEIADRSLMALREISNSLAPLPGRKSLVVFSSGIHGSEYRMREAERSAQAANVAIYPWDAKGLIAPGAGNAAATTLAVLESQQFMNAMAVDTGGAPLFGVNDPGPLFDKIHHDASSYYLIGYYTSNPVMDGQLRHLLVAVDRPGVTLAYRDRYFAQKTFTRLTAAERKEQLRDEAIADEPEHSLSPEVTAEFARAGTHFHLSARVMVPAGDRPANVAMDALVLVEDESGHEAAESSAVIKPGAPGEVTANFEVPAGQFHVMVAVREDQGGKMGATDTIVTIH